MANKKHDLKQTYQRFEIVGKVAGTQSEKFYDPHSVTQKGSIGRKLMFDVTFDEKGNKADKIKMFLNGYEQKLAYHSIKNADGTSTSVPVDWSHRYQFEPNATPIGAVRIGLEKETDENGVTKNKNQSLYKWDAAEYISEHLQDEQSVFVKGTYSIFNGQLSMAPDQISLMSKDIDFAQDNYKPRHSFKQSICYTGIHKSEENPNQWILTGYSIEWNSIRETSLIVENEQLANQFMKAKIEPYTYMELWGTIECRDETEPVEDVWGEASDMDKQSSPYSICLVMTGADPHSFDKTIYSEDSVEDAIQVLQYESQAEADYNGKSSNNSAGGAIDWGTSNDDDDDDPWL